MHVGMYLFIQSHLAFVNNCSWKPICLLHFRKCCKVLNNTYLKELFNSLGAQKFYKTLNKILIALVTFRCVLKFMCHIRHFQQILLILTL